MRRDRMTFAMMIAIPIMQLMLFGFAINSDPRHMPTVVEVNDNGPFTRAFLAAMETSTYFDIRGTVANNTEADRILVDGGDAPSSSPFPRISSATSCAVTARRSSWTPTPPIRRPPRAPRWRR